MKYSTIITGWGTDALSFLQDETDPFIIIFDNDAPPELADIAILHEKAELSTDPAVGDKLTICNKTFRITAIGYEALQTLRTLGHCTLKFTGKDEADLPGCMMLKGERLTAADIQVGGKIELA